METINIRKENLKKLGYTSLEQWLQNPKHIYIGRSMEHYVPGAKQSKWHNPFKIDKNSIIKDQRKLVIEKYREYLLNNEKLLNEIGELEGKVLGCWCKPLGCHGDVLVEVLEYSRRSNSNRPKIEKSRFQVNEKDFPSRKFFLVSESEQMMD